mmetsp:Transcript_20238/g.35361  ORF Transcript_20238/g.35361 Transcript_20238/m.35361 type:complete len:93 (+) Transcript_20238:191-469(+)
MEPQWRSLALTILKAFSWKPPKRRRLKKSENSKSSLGLVRGVREKQAHTYDDGCDSGIPSTIDCYGTRLKSADPRASKMSDRAAEPDSLRTL